MKISQKASQIFFHLSIYSHQTEMSIFIELSPTETRDQYLQRITENKLYRIDPEFSNRYFLANSADPD